MQSKNTQKMFDINILIQKEMIKRSAARICKQFLSKTISEWKLFNRIKARPNKLLNNLIDNIKKNGPMSIAEFMNSCLTDPEFGYYTTKPKIFNKGGDFTTSPEVGQLFGEMIGVWIQVLYQRMEKTFKCPGIPLSIVELGPGTGELAVDILKTLLTLRKTLKGLNMGFIEVSEKLRNIQQEKLLKFLQTEGVFMNYQKMETVDAFVSEAHKDLPFTMNWGRDLTELMCHDFERVKPTGKPEPCVMVAHELFDALPVYQFEYSKTDGWCERQVQIKQGLASSQPQLAFGRSKGPNKRVIDILQPEKRFPVSLQQTFPDGTGVELSPDAWRMMKEISTYINSRFGACLIVDYGDAKGFSNSLRGVKAHRFVETEEILKLPGEIDLSVNVNFAELASIVRLFPNLKAHKLLQQNEFLVAMGITQRVEMLSKNKSRKTVDSLIKQYERLCDPEQMGKAYKCFVAAHKFFGDVYPFIQDMEAKREYV